VRCAPPRAYVLDRVLEGVQPSSRCAPPSAFVRVCVLERVCVLLFQVRPVVFVLQREFSNGCAQTRASKPETSAPALHTSTS
jgi:hypothetical protein